MRKTSWLFWLLFFASALAGAGNIRACEVIQIGEIILGAKVADVKKTMGEPSSMEKKDGFIRTTYKYDGLRVGFDEDGKVAEIESSSPRYCFKDWLCPRMNYDKAKKLALRQKAVFEKGRFTIYGDGCWMSAQSDKKIVTAINIKCEP